MASKLIKHLHEKCQEHEHLALLENQWKYDENLIPKALQNIGQLFPHYSRHDVSHSTQILVNIERLLGDDIQKLGATDTWLILESAYWHDVGMVVPADEIARDLETQEFKQYVLEITNTTGHELQEFAKKFDPRDAASCFSGAGTPLEATDKLRLFLAEYYRRKHPERAESMVIDPWAQAGISSPRNELLPKRLFFMLGRICHLHGKDFECIFDELEFRQVGMAQENCHPRFVACLLRLGDLLDLDDNRFCPVMRRVAGNIPASSQAHIDKHNSIRHFRLDRERIEISASCPNSASYEETERWFSWLKMEMQNQMARWEDIVPERAFGLLPTLGALHVDLDGDEQWLDVESKERPRFDIDAEKTIELLQGSGLYERPEQSLRELLQNAVDATLQRVWLEFYPTEGNAPLHKEWTPKNWNNPYDPNMKELLKQYPIEVELSRLNNQPEQTKLHWQLTIKDRGIGISKDDLKWIRRVGSSSKNVSRRDRIERMPAWMKPSGVFGIGMQSAFLLADTIHFQTKSYVTGETQDLTLYSPLGNQRGLITIKKCEAFPGNSAGSILQLTHAFEKMPKRISWGHESKAYEVLCRFDPVSDQEMEFEPAKWAEEIEDFAKYSPIPIHFQFKGSPHALNQAREEPSAFFDDTTNIGLQVYPCNGTRRDLVYFRGQKVEKYSTISLPFLAVAYHLWGDSAGTLLTINRNNIKYDGLDDLQHKQIDALSAYLEKQIPDPEKEENSAYISAFIQNMEWEGKYPLFKDQWKNLRLLPGGDKTLKDLYALESFSVKRLSPLLSPQKTDETFKNKESNDGIIEFIVGPHDDSILKLLAHRWQKDGYHLQIVDKTAEYTKIIFQKIPFTPSIPYTAEALKAVLKHHLRALDPCSRILFPLYPDYQRLALKDGVNFFFAGILPEANYLHSRLMVMPFCFFVGSRADRHVTNDRLDDLCRWTVKHASDSALTFEDAHALYKKFIDWIDKEIMGDDAEWKRARGMPPSVV